MYKCFFKRIFDFSAATILLIFASPVLLIIIFILGLTNRGKVFFVQTRIGKNNRPFKLIKFKTMHDKRDNQGVLLPSHLRLTKIGKFLRTLSLDELPQLINIMTGDMSLIGPRPLLVKYLPLYNERQLRRHELRPGITGWAQVNGRNTISWQEKFDYDVYYVDHLSFFFDLKIFLLTIKKVLIREGINSGELISMEEFKGNE